MAADRHDPDTKVDDDMDTVARLIHTAGRRAEPPAEAFEQTLASATDAWRAKVHQRRQRNLFVGLAASLVVAGSVAFLVANLPPESVPSVARADRLIGTVEIRSDANGGWSTLRDETMQLAAGSHLRTHAGSRAGIVLDTGVSVRLADATNVVLESGSSLRLVTGRVYLDTGETGHVARRIQVVTAAGTARDVGTQFEVLYRGEAYRLRVRDGRVLLSRDAGDFTGGAGDQLTIDASGGLERTRIAQDDAEWQWVESVAPAPDIDEKPLSVLLEWVARETGRAVAFDKPEVERKASTTILHGSIRNLTPLEALSVMLATTDLEYVLPDDGTILIRLKVTR
ncbi:MAG TPA: FecR domain-containing protein [Steroidobacteraceae bacterium]